MNKLKKAIADFEAYLGRDKEGLRRLSAIKQLANEIRKQRTSLQDQLEELTEQLDRVRKDRDDAKTKAQIAKAAMETESARRTSAELREKALSDAFAKFRQEMESNPEALDSVERGDAKFEEIFRPLIVQMLRRFPHGPPKTSTPRRAIVVQDVVKNYSFDEYASLGMIVSTMALANMPVYVESREAILLKDHGVSEKMLEKFIQWYRNWIRITPWDGGKHPYSGGTMVESTPLGPRQIVKNLTIRNTTEI